MIKIYSDGTPAGTRVFQDNGAELTGITNIVWTIDGRSEHLATAVITFEQVQVEVKAEV